MTKPAYQISFSNADNVSAWGGLALWAQFLKALRFRSQQARWSMPHPPIQSRLRYLFACRAICHQRFLRGQSILSHEYFTH